MSELKPADPRNEEGSFQWMEKAKDAAIKYLFPISGGGVVLGSALGFFVYLTYCARIDYLPLLSLKDYADLFFCLTMSGTVLLALVTLVPFLPGAIYRFVRPTPGFEGPLDARWRDQLLLCYLLAGNLIGGYAGFFTHFVVNGRETDLLSFRRSLWTTVPVFCLLAIAVVLAVFVIVSPRLPVSGDWRSYPDRATRLITESREVLTMIFCGLVGGATMAAYGPVLASMAAAFTDLFFGQLLFILVPIALVCVGNILIASSYGGSFRKVTVFALVCYAVLCIALLLGPASESLMAEFGLRTPGPIEITIEEANLARVPAAIRDRLDTRADLTTNPHTYAVRGLYLILRIGGEFRVGVPSNVQEERSSANPLATAWSMPDSAILAWRKVEFYEIEFPKDGEKPKLTAATGGRPQP